MSHESVPETRRQTGQTGQAAHDHAHQESAVPAQGGGAPKGLLQQMEELMAALNADLSQLDADLQHSADRTPSGTTLTPGSRTPESEPHSDRSF
ncbi:MULTISPECIES: hypothetical protein [unclassified Streptomyces]|uniref:hypothetical protein n=1 Tax=unclassified Streptomyces TaxID=2593676 RepID=UPI001BEB30B7|nr:MULTISPECIES: hypothetical protein [unclassified Streptomyces]MBT2407732.1 hypothetical protein [Streptomyces sp. ISL-21]MBT2457835.1 hypothetical protein [Streptomyces sp. ISL-86]MBT2612360.1 hypothetical protein [Streptomyces sp. ISL-87]